MSKENQTNRAPQLLSQAICWLADLNQQKDIEDQLENLSYIQTAFMCSTQADDHESRNEAIVFFMTMENLFKIMQGFTREDFKALNITNLKFLELCNSIATKSA